MIRVNPLVVAKLQYWQVQAKDNEISVFGRVIPKNGDALLTDVFLPKQSGDKVKNDVEVVDYAALLTEVFKNNKIPPTELRCHIHTHPSFSTGASSEDTHTANNVLNFPIYITGIYNGTTFSFFLNLKEPYVARIPMEYIIDYTLLYSAKKMESWKTTFNKNYTVKQIACVSYGDTYNEYYPSYSKAFGNNETYSLALTCTKLIRQYLNKTPEFLIQRVQSRKIIVGDAWKPTYAVNSTMYEEYGFHFSTLEDYIALCLIPSNKMSYEKKNAIVMSDVQLTRTDELLGFLVVHEPEDYQEILNSVGDGPWPITTFDSEDCSLKTDVNQLQLLD